jgi:hypothetical protein
MQRTSRRLSAVLLAFTLLALPAAARAEPAARGVDRWLVSVLDALGDLVGGLWTIGAASETGDPLPDDDGGSEVDSDPGDTESEPITKKIAPRWDPTG